ncbi:hypothetical protein [Streptomyces sp. NBC_01618]|uniref:hypothetical protein n=1 Tax=Streptomyces sp. NBC_01618 TaxID=2975900 RepID=UPI003870A84D|nr:hypothetical protein OH735_01225 [Streptomyces sp. NBC_01618]
MNTSVHDRSRPVLYGLVITAMAAVPWFVAVLPLTFNGVQLVQESGAVGTGSAETGFTMLALAALPAIISLLVLAQGLASRLPLRATVNFAAAALFIGGMISFLSASLFAMV